MARLVIFALAWLGLTVVAASAAPAFDPDAATRAWIATMGPQAIARSNAYFEGGYWLQFAGAALSIIIAMALMILGWAKGVRAWLEAKVKIYFFVCLLMALFYVVVAQVITFPFDWYVGFVRQHQYGLSNQNFGAWFGEYAISAVISAVLTAFFIAVLYLIVRAAKNAWWIWGAAVTALFLAAQVALFPVYVAPIFNTYTEMPASPLKDDILTMAEANGVPAHNVYVYDRSRQTNSISANVSGLFSTTRVSLADTLLKRCDSGCVRAVMGHELGHYVLNHVASLILMFTVFVAVIFALIHVSFLRLTRNERWGVRALWDPAGLPLVVALATFFGVIATPISNNIVRFHESQADYFGINAAREPDGFAEASLLLSEYRKMEPSPFEEWFFYDHPSGYARIHMAMVWKANQIAAGRLPASAGGPPPGWRPDFVVMHQGAENAPRATAASPDAP
ncbi:MAG TPA: M48 family metallopeptidase [Caulobacterales bacterium]|nr:M48 family metallopeptidase [Caulobacterales bacterium]